MSRTSNGLQRFALRVPDTQALFGMGVGPGPILLYGLLQTHVGRNDHCWPSQAKLAEELNVDERRIRRWLSQLQKAGVLTVVHTGRRNHYYPHAPAQTGEDRPPTPDTSRHPHMNECKEESRRSKVVVEAGPEPANTTTSISVEPTPLPSDNTLRYQRTAAQITLAQWSAHDASAPEVRLARDRLAWLEHELAMLADTRWAWDLIQRIPGWGTPERGYGGIASLEHLWTIRSQHAGMGRGRWRRSVRRWCEWHSSQARHEEIGSFAGWIAKDDVETVSRSECPAAVDAPTAKVSDRDDVVERGDARSADTPWQCVLQRLADEPGWQMLTEHLWESEPRRESGRLVLLGVSSFVAVQLGEALARCSTAVNRAIREVYGMSLDVAASG